MVTMFILVTLLLAIGLVGAFFIEFVLAYILIYGGFLVTGVLVAVILFHLGMFAALLGIYRFIKTRGWLSKQAIAAREGWKKTVSRIAKIALILGMAYYLIAAVTIGVFGYFLMTSVAPSLTLPEVPDFHVAVFRGMDV